MEETVNSRHACKLTQCTMEKGAWRVELTVDDNRALRFMQQRPSLFEAVHAAWSNARDYLQKHVDFPADSLLGYLSHGDACWVIEERTRTKGWGVLLFAGLMSYNGSSLEEAQVGTATLFKTKEDAERALDNHVVTLKKFEVKKRKNNHLVLQAGKRKLIYTIRECKFFQ